MMRFLIKEGTRRWNFFVLLKYPLHCFKYYSNIKSVLNTYVSESCQWLRAISNNQRNECLFKTIRTFFHLLGSLSYVPPPESSHFFKVTI